MKLGKFSVRSEAIAKPRAIDGRPQSIEHRVCYCSVPGQGLLSVWTARSRPMSWRRWPVAHQVRYHHSEAAAGADRSGRSQSQGFFYFLVFMMPNRDLVAVDGGNDLVAS